MMLGVDRLSYRWIPLLTQMLFSLLSSLVLGSLEFKGRCVPTFTGVEIGVSKGVRGPLRRGTGPFEHRGI